MISMPAKNYSSWRKFDEIMMKRILRHFRDTVRVTCTYFSQVLLTSVLTSSGGGNGRVQGDADACLLASSYLLLGLGDVERGRVVHGHGERHRRVERVAKVDERRHTRP